MHAGDLPSAAGANAAAADAHAIAARPTRDARRVTAPGETFHWTCTKDHARLASTFDPFGNVTVKQGVQLEIAWLGYRLGQDNLDQAIEEQLAGQLTMRQAAQLRSDWKRYVLDAA